jgi:2'-aminobiphenyl-2,3-diol 1,2-dioxygenase, large subunit
MGEIVGALGVSHILAAWKDAETQADRVFAGMQEVGRRVQSAKPDIIVMITSDHMANFAMGLQVPFTVGVSDEYISLGDMNIPKMRVRGHRAFAEGLVAFAAEASFDLAKAEEIRPDHGVMVPRLLADPPGNTALVLLYININMLPVPKPRRCWELGRTIANFARSRPAKERIVVLATGGLSHWILTSEMGRVNEAFDRECLQLIVSGQAESLAAVPAARIEEQAGNGGLELLNWLCMAGSVPGRTGEVVFYEPMRKWSTGMAGISMFPEAP